MKLRTHEEITQHLRELRSALTRRHGWSLERMAEEIGVKRHTLSQYCQLPDTKGARQIPARSLDFLRRAVIELDRELWDRHFPTYLGREQKSWFVMDPDMSAWLETHSLFAAEMYAARRGGGIVTPGPESENPDEQLSGDERLCVEWVQVVESGFVDLGDIVEVTGVGEYELDLIACPQRNWRIQPTQEQVDAIRDRAMERTDEAA